MNEQNGSHWWGFYGVRYAQGTVVGAMLVFFLFTQNDMLKKLLFIPPEPKDFGMPHLILLAIYGLAYCYIASAPILIMHAGRGLIFASHTRKEAILRMFWLFIIPSLVTVAITYFCIASSSNKMLWASAIFLFSLLLIFQIQILIGIFYTSWQKVIDYYTVIVKKRKEHKDSDYIESYKHIREHGNSFLIVVFQFCLALPIYVFVSQPTITSEDAIRNLVAIIFLWVLPASSIWVFGIKLENNLQSM